MVVENKEKMPRMWSTLVDQLPLAWLRIKYKLRVLQLRKGQRTTFANQSTYEH